MSDNNAAVLAALAEIINEVAGIDIDKVTPEAGFTTDLDLDSLSMVEVVVATEQKFDIRIPDSAVNDLVTVGDAISYIETAGLTAGRLA